MTTKLREDLDKLYATHVIRGRETYHEFCRTVAMSLGWPTQRVYNLISPYYPDKNLYDGEQSIYENMHRYGF